MSLVDALLLDPVPFDVWVALRTDGQRGTGSNGDPFNGSPTQGPWLSVTLTNSTSTAATSREGLAVSAASLGLVEGDVVTISGVTGTDADYWSGSFVVYGVSGNTFKFWMKRKGTVLSPGTIQPPPASNQLKVSKLTYQFDEVMRRLASLANTFMRLHIGPGTFETRGHSAHALVMGRPQIWQPKPGMKIIGSGIDVTVLKLVFADVQEGNYYAIEGSTYGSLVDYMEVAELTVDCNLPGQPPSPPISGPPLGPKPGADYPAVACSAVALNGVFCRIRRVKAINWGTECNSEAFVLALGPISPDFPDRLTNAVIEDCICVQPSDNNRYTSTVLHVGGGYEPYAWRNTYSRGTVIRRSFIDSNFSGGRSSFLLTVQQAFHDSSDAPEVWRLKTYRPHGRNTGNRINLFDATDGTSVWNGYFEVERVDDMTLKVVLPSSSPPTSHPLVFGTYFNGLSMGGTQGGVVEDNVVYNTIFGGPYADTGDIKEIIVRRNHYKNVLVSTRIGLGRMSPGPLGIQSIVHTTENGEDRAEITTLGKHGLALGEFINVRQVTPSDYNQDNVPITKVTSESAFQYPISSNLPPGTDLDRSYVERNVAGLVSLAHLGGGVAEATTPPTSNRGILVGDRVRITHATKGATDFTPAEEYNGYFEVTYVSGVKFRYKMNSVPSGNAFNATYQRNWGIDRLIMEDNLVELHGLFYYEYGAPSSAIEVFDDLANDGNPNPPPYGHGEIVIRRNAIRHVDGVTDPDFYLNGLSVYSAKRLEVTDNTIDVVLANPLRDFRCGAVAYQNNRTSRGALLQGQNGTTLLRRSELEVEITDASILAM